MMVQDLENPLGIALLLLAASVLGGLIAASVTALWLQRRWRRHWSSRFAEELRQLEQRWGDEVEERVRRGTSQGITDGVSSLPSKETLKAAARSATRSGHGLLRELLGARPSGQEDER